MTGSIIISGKDIKSAYGAYLVDGALSDLPCFPDMKEPERNDWYEEDGIEVDLEKPCVESHEMTVSMMMPGSLGNVSSLMEYVRSARFHDVEFSEAGRSRKLRLVSMMATGLSMGLFGIDITLADESPLEGLSGGDVTSSSRQCGLAMDGVDLCAYGILLNGNADHLWPSAEVKDNILAESDFINGEKHYDEMEEAEDDRMKVTVHSDDIKVGCVMISKSITEFWRKRDALLTALVAPGERTLSYMGRSYKAYYKNCNSSLFDYSGGKKWWEFELTFGYIGEVI